MNAERAELESIDQIGPVMGRSIYEYFRHVRHRAVIDDLLAAGVRPESPAPKQGAGKLEGRTIVVTGTLKHFTRRQVQQAIQKVGGKATSSVSKKTDFLLAGEDPGSKLATARKLGVVVVDEKQFLEMIDLEAE
jgi:DNA ligase (NAD+)